tara:strand:+ start:319 stop:486 length:168 start_codon:yes stop_codon:yes gene_type:complete
LKFTDKHENNKKDNETNNAASKTAEKLNQAKLQNTKSTKLTFLCCKTSNKIYNKK